MDFKRERQTIKTIINTSNIINNYKFIIIINTVIKTIIWKIFGQMDPVTIWVIGR